MNKKQLIELLEQYPDDIEIWIDDAGYIEGGKRLESIEKLYAWDANLDGDTIDDEWIYADENLTGKSKILLESQFDKYHLIENGEVYSKEILLIKGL